MSGFEHKLAPRIATHPIHAQSAGFRGQQAGENLKSWKAESPGGCQISSFQTKETDLFENTIVGRHINPSPLLGVHQNSSAARRP